MIKKVLLSILLYSTGITFPQALSTGEQVQFSKIFEKKYNELPIKIRMDNSGIYAISSFDVKGNIICFNSFDDQASYSFQINNYSNIIRTEHSLRDYNLDFEDDQKKFLQENLSLENDLNIKFKKSFLKNSRSLFIDEDGFLTNNYGEEIFLNVVSRNEFKINFNLKNFNKAISLSFPSNLACSDLIGIDTKGNIFLLIETFISDIPLKVQREIYTLSSDGKILSILEIPSIKYLYTIRDFQIDEEGNLYHLLCEKEKVSIIKWSGLTNPSMEKIPQTGSRYAVINYPPEYNYVLHFNDFVSTKEALEQTETGNNNIEQLASRVEALRIGEKYVLYKYACSEPNLVPDGVIAPDGDDVKTPAWLIKGYNARIPYKWGGFSTLSDFNNGLLNGKYAGDINTSGVSSYAIGVDCSGFVSRCWQMTYHASTSYMPSITTQYSSWDELKPGDAIHKVGHVRLFIQKTPNGSLKVVESAGRNWDVSYWTFTLSDLAAYTPRYYNNMMDDYSTQQPLLKSALLEHNGKTMLSWDCDTTNLKGFRLYNSTDGMNWTLIQNEDQLKTTSTIVSRNNNTEYYRVSSVLNNGPAFSESNWSNVLGVAEYSSEKKILLVDGFERETGSWRGPEHTFVMRYGQAFQPLSMNFESIKNKLIEDSLISLNDYDAVFWILGDESTEDETFSSLEQNLVRNYLENGGKLFVSGSEIGWDLFEKGNASDKEFYNHYLKAIYISDNSASNIANGVDGLCFNGISFNIGQTYYEDYPDEINSYGESSLCMKYSNNKGAGIEFTGKFGTSNDSGKIIYLAFPLETTANDSAFNSVISNSIEYFFSEPTSAANELSIINDFKLYQNYPNPFNPGTMISWQSPIGSWQTLKVYDILGREVITLVHEYKPAGEYEIDFNGSKLSSGIYFYKIHLQDLSSGKIFEETKSMMLLK